MKTKKLNKKLMLNKKTLVNLNAQELFRVHGGGDTETRTCPTMCNTYCPERCPDTDYTYAPDYCPTITCENTCVPCF